MSYINFIHTSFEYVRLSEDNSNSVHPNFIKWTVLWALVFTLLHLSFSTLSSHLMPKKFNSLSLSKRNDLGTYVLSTLHHFVVCPYIIYSLGSDFAQYTGDTYRFPENHLDNVYATNGILAFTLGFFTGDICGHYIPRLFTSKPDYLYTLHHLVAMYALFYYRQMSGPLLLGLHMTLLTEISSIFFNLAWICRNLFGASVPPVAVALLEYSFALTFFLARVVHLPLFLTLHYEAVLQESPIFVACVGLGVAMQFFWFFKILKSLLFGRGKKNIE